MAKMKKITKTRLDFTRKYGRNTSAVVRYTIQGRDSNWIANKTGISRTTIAAIKANLTRGTYHPYADMNFTGKYYGDCKY